MHQFDGSPRTLVAMSKPLLIVQTGHTPDRVRKRFGDFDDFFCNVVRTSSREIRIVEADVGGSLPDPLTVGRAIITGSPTMITDWPPWVERLAGWVRGAFDVGLPMFGVCFGHQIMCKAMGGHVDWLEGEQREMGTKEIELLDEAWDDPLLHGLPRHFYAHTTHSQTVIEAPPGAHVLGRSQREHHHIVRHSPTALSVQFHPEFSVEVIKTYLRLRQEGLRDEGQDPELLLKQARATPHARRILRRFARG